MALVLFDTPAFVFRLVLLVDHKVFHKKEANKVASWQARAPSFTPLRGPPARTRGGGDEPEYFLTATRHGARRLLALALVDAGVRLLHCLLVGADQVGSTAS